MNRPSWDEYFLAIAREVTKRSVCLRHQIGAVIVRNKRILTTGYNGPPSGIMHCEARGGCKRARENIPSGTRLDEDYALHAEMNAIVQAALHGVSTEGATLYCTHEPCSLCAKAIINAGIRRVVSSEFYANNAFASKLLCEAGIAVEIVSPVGS